MAAEGHRPVRNSDPAGADEIGPPILESSQPERVTRIALPYYQPPLPRHAVPPEAITEALLPETSELESGEADLLFEAAEASYGETFVLEAVIGNDDRVRVAEAFLGNNPWRQICALRIHAVTGKTFVGTAWFIGEQVLATAGHCVYMIKEGGWAESIDVIPAKSGPDEPFGRLASSRFATVDGWIKGPNRDFDYGVIFLDDTTIGRRVGNFAVDAPSDAGLAGVIGNISGYPLDRDRAEFQYFHARAIHDVTPTRLDYDVDTFGGQSGSPIWMELSPGAAVAVGIHTTGSVTGNSGTRISGHVLDNLILWNEAR